MKKKIVSALVAGAMCVCMLPVGALAATPGAPALTGVSIAGNTATMDANGNLYLTMPSNTWLAGQTFSLTTSKAVSFNPTQENAAADGELYAYTGSANSANLRFAIDMSSHVGGSDINFNTPAYSIDLTSADRITWNGAFNSGFATNVATLGQAMNATHATLRANTIRDDGGQGNDTMRIHANFDAANTQLVFYDPTSVTYTVTYNYDGGSYGWQLPAGAPLPEVTIPGNDTVLGWYEDSGFAEDTLVNFTGATVTKSMTLYAKTESASTPTDKDTFLADLNDPNATELRISTPNDFADFAAHSTEVDPGELVVLENDINLGGATYQAIQFEGNFDGKNHTISNAKFTRNGSYAGMFSELGENQKIANLYLDNITVTGNILSGYAGVLAGQFYGNAEGNRLNTIIQNVHVTNSSVSGYTSGGLVGFAFVNTIRYCSVENTSVTGTANGGGIAGLSYSDIIACYSTVSPFGLQSRGRGGIAGKLLESGKIQDCWCSYQNVYGSLDEGLVTVTNVVKTSQGQSDWAAWMRALTNKVWTLGTQSASLIKTAIEYNF